MKYHILHDFRTSTPIQENPSDHFNNFHKLKLFTNFDVGLISLPGEFINNVLNVLFITPAGDEVRLISEYFRSFSL